MKTIERIAKMEEKLDNLEKKVDDGFENLGKRIDNLPAKFASKWVEKFCWLLVGGMMTAGIGLLVWLVQKG